MKQGRATHTGSGSTKVEPRSHSVPPAYPARLGNKIGNHAMDKGKFRPQSVPMYEGRGIEAPMKSVKTYPKGSQR